MEGRQSNPYRWRVAGVATAGTALVFGSTALSQHGFTTGERASVMLIPTALIATGIILWAWLGGEVGAGTKLNLESLGKSDPKDLLTAREPIPGRKRAGLG